MSRALVLLLLLTLQCGCGGELAIGLSPQTLLPPGPVEAELAADLLGEVNDDRVKAGSLPVVRSADLDAVAQAHARDMVDRNYFSHTNPDGETVRDRLEVAGIDWTIYGELMHPGSNAAAGVVGDWVAFEDQRVVLRAAFTQVGIGVADAGGGVYVFVALLHTP